VKITPIYHPIVRHHPVVNHGGAMREHLGLIEHIQVGDGSLYNRFNDPATEVSSTWWVAKDGTIEEYVPPGVVAWAQADGNDTYNSVETEGGFIDGKPNTNDPMPLRQIAGLAHLLRLVHAAYGVPYKEANRVGERGYGWHGMGGVAWGDHPDCPGKVRKAQRRIVVHMAAGSTVKAYGELAREVDDLKRHYGWTPNGKIGPRVRLLMGL
jgi:N-acetylmuramoyl-L-alanine amidase